MDCVPPPERGVSLRLLSVEERCAVPFLLAPFSLAVERMLSKARGLIIHGAEGGGGVRLWLRVENSHMRQRCIFRRVVCEVLATWPFISTIFGIGCIDGSFLVPGIH